MGISSGQRQKKYRDKKKEQDLDGWKKAERDRVKEYYVKSKDLSEKQMKIRRDKNRKNMKKQKDMKNSSSVQDVSVDVQKLINSSPVEDNSSNDQMANKNPKTTAEKE